MTTINNVIELTDEQKNAIKAIDAKVKLDVDLKEVSKNKLFLDDVKRLTKLAFEEEQRIRSTN